MWIVPCLEGGTSTRTSGSSIYPAVQNMLLAASALGLGATLTTLYLAFEGEAEAALGLPAGVHSYAILPTGYPNGPIWTGAPCPAGRCRLRRSVGPALSKCVAAQTWLVSRLPVRDNLVFGKQSRQRLGRNELDPGDQFIAGNAAFGEIFFDDVHGYLPILD